MTAMPFVKPITIEIGMNLIKPPSLKSPMKNSMMPDPIVASIRLEIPY